MRDAAGLIPFVDIAAQRARLGQRLDAAIARVLEHGKFILGPEVQALESELISFTGAAHCITCANGTDALSLVLMAEGIGPGDAVIVPSFSFIAPAEIAAQLGAAPVFADVDADTFNIEPASVVRAIEAAKRKSLNLRAIIAVDLFGQPADYSALASLATEHSMLLVADAAQSFGASQSGRMVGTLADYTTTSFFPAKPLGCYGDGGAIFVDDAGKADLLRSLRFHGRGTEKYANERVGLNSRLDTLQAAILLEKLNIFRDELESRNRIAARYQELLAGTARVPRIEPHRTTSWAQFTLQFKNAGERDEVRRYCSGRGIPTAVYYPSPGHLQPAYRHFAGDPEGLPVSERLAATVLSLPLHAYLDEQTQIEIAAAVKGALGMANS